MSDSEHRVDRAIRERARRLRSEMTIPEWHLWNCLKSGQVDGYRFRRQHPIGTFVVDFCCERTKLVVELDGQSHDETEEYDGARTDVLKRMGYRVLRFTNDQVLGDVERVVEEIRSELRRK